MAFEVQIDADFNPDGFEKVPNGKFHVSVDSVEEEGGKKGEMVLFFEILMADDKIQIGKKIRDQVPRTKEWAWKMHRLAMCLGMITADEIKRMKAEGRMPSYDFPAACGKQCHIELSTGKKDPKYQEKDFYKIDDAFCAAWPKNKGWLDRAGIKVPAAPAAPSGTGNGAPSATPQVNLTGIV